MDKTYKGACMCGAIRFSFRGAPRFVADCVCDSCRRAHGATAVCWTGVNTEQFHLDAGTAELTWYHSSAASERGFCGVCGSTLFFRSQRWPGEMHMAVACLDAPHDLVATDVSYSEEFPPWTVLRALEQGH